MGEDRVGVGCQVKLGGWECEVTVLLVTVTERLEHCQACLPIGLLIRGRQSN